MAVSSNLQCDRSRQC